MEIDERDTANALAADITEDSVIAGVSTSDLTMDGKKECCTWGLGAFNDCSEITEPSAGNLCRWPRKGRPKTVTHLEKGLESGKSTDTETPKSSLFLESNGSVLAKEPNKNCIDSRNVLCPIPGCKNFGGRGYR